MDSRLLRTVFVGFIVFLSGCVTQGIDIDSVVKQLPAVEEFLKQHPDAKIRAVSLSAETVQESMDEIEKVCGAPLPVKGYWKVEVAENNDLIIAIVDAEKLSPVCVSRTTLTDGGEIVTPLPPEETPSSPIDVVDAYCVDGNKANILVMNIGGISVNTDDISVTRIQGKGVLSLNWNKESIEPRTTAILTDSGCTTTQSTVCAYKIIPSRGVEITAGVSCSGYTVPPTPVPYPAPIKPTPTPPPKVGEGNMIFADDFNKADGSPSGWTSPNKAMWKIDNNELSMKQWSDFNHPLILSAGMTDAKDYVVKAKVTVFGYNDEVGVCARMNERGFGYCYSMGWGGADSTMISFFGSPSYNPGFIAAGPQIPIIADNSYYIKLWVYGNELKGKVWNTKDSEPADWSVESKSTLFSSGKIGFYTYGEDARFDDVEVRELIVGETKELPCPFVAPPSPDSCPWGSKIEKDAQGCITFNCPVTTANATTPVAFGNYKIYATLGDNGKWTKIVIQDSAGMTMDTLVLAIGSTKTSLTTSLDINLVAIRALADGTVIGADLYVKESSKEPITGTANATTPVAFGNYKLYTPLGSNGTWARINIVNSTESTVDALVINKGDTKTSTVANLSIKVVDVRALSDGTVIGADLLLRYTTKLKLCPNEWIINHMPSTIGQSGDAYEYYIVNGKRRELYEFDIDWIKENCNVKPQIVQ